MNAAAPPPAPDRWQRLRESQEHFARVLGLLAVLLYVLGLLTVNAYLDQYGVSEFSLVRPRAIVTGAGVAVRTRRVTSAR